MRLEVRGKGGTLALTVRCGKSLESYHRTLGHAGPERIKKLLKQIGLAAPTETVVDCPNCPEGRGRQVPHPSVGPKAEKPGVIHVDLAYVNKASLNGARR